MNSSIAAARFPGLQLSKEEIAGTSSTVDGSLLAEEPSDDLLIVQIGSGNDAALGVLFHRYARLVWSVGWKILRNDEEADDLVQDVFLLVRRKAPIFDPSKGSVRSLLVQMCYQRAISRRRYLRVRHFYTSKDLESDGAARIPAPSTPPYDESLEAHFGKGVLGRALDDLPEEQRTTLMLYFFGGYTFEEIAAELKQSFGNVRHYYYRGIRKLRKQMEELKKEGRNK
jgi:RNA polymerase sigma-70 factor, ECF subfamily